MALLRQLPGWQVFRINPDIYSMHGNGLLKIFIAIAALSLLLDIYVYAGLRSWTQKWTSKRRRRIVLSSYLLIAVGITLLLLLRLPSFRTGNGMRPFNEWMLSMFIGLLISKIFFALVLLAGDLVRLITGLFRTVAKADGPAIPARRRFLIDAAILFASIPFTSFLYAMIAGKYDYRVFRQVFYFDDLPPAFDGFTITQVSDIHSGSFDNHAAVRKGVDLVKAQQSDLFVFTGDLVNNVATEIEPWLDMFAEIKAPHGQFSILGNHDYGDYVKWDSPEAKQQNLEKLKQQHARLGYRLLMDEAVTIERKGEQLSLVGVQNWGRGFIQKGDLDKALITVPNDAFKILLSHDPTHWEEIIRYHPAHIHLTLSGHTHGAQFGVETPGLRWSPVKYRYLDWAGPASENNRHLYVNRGFGFLAFSGRLGIWPEVTVIELRKGKAKV